MNPMRVVLTGTYCSKNKGDAAMQQVFAAEILKRRPEAEIIVATPFPGIDASHYAPLPVIRSGRRNLPLGTLHWAVLELLRLAGLAPRGYFPNEEIDAFARADAVVDLSGDMLTEDYGPLVGYSHFLPLLQAQALGKPTIVCAQSIGPFNRLKGLAKRVLTHATLISVRESITPNLLAALNASTLAPVRTADLAFLLPAAPRERIDALLAAEGITRSDRPRLGVSVSALLTNRTNRHLDSISQNGLDAFAQALDEMIEKSAIEVLLVPHVFGPRPSGDDRKAGEVLSARMRNSPLRLRGEYRPEELKGVISRCDAFVGCRMHANIAALDSGLPVLAIGYSHKTRGIMADLGLGEWVLSADNLDPGLLAGTIVRLLLEAPGYRRRLETQLPQVRQRAAENIDLTLLAIDAASDRQA